MKKFKLYSPLLLCFACICGISAFAQNQPNPNPYDTTFYGRIHKILESRLQQYPTDTNGNKSSQVKEIERMLEIWGPRLYPHGNARKAQFAQNKYIQDFNNGIRGYCGKYDTTKWIEKGPNQLPDSSVDGVYDNVKGTGQINRITFSPKYNGTTNKTIFACSHYGGAFKSIDNGVNWTILNTDLELPFSGVADIAVDYDHEDTLYIAVGNGDATNGINGYGTWLPINNPIPLSGVYRSYDGGANWTNISGSLLSSLGFGGQIRRILTDPNDGTRLFIATTKGVYHCANPHTASPYWTLENNAPFGSDSDLRGLEFKPDNSNVIYAGGKHIYRSTDGGYIWNCMTLASSSLNMETFKPLAAEGNTHTFDVLNTNLAVSPAAPKNIYAYVVAIEKDSSRKSAFIYYYNDTAWQLLDQYHCQPMTLCTVSTKWIGLAVSPTNPKAVYYGFTHVRGTPNFDTDTFKLQSGYGRNGFHPDVHDLVFQPNIASPKLLAAHHGGVSVKDITQNNKLGWVYRNNGLHAGLVLTFDNSLIKKNQYVIGTWDCGTMVHATNANNWRTIHGGDGNGAQIFNEAQFRILSLSNSFPHSFVIASNNHVSYMDPDGKEFFGRPDGHIHSTHKQEEYSGSMQIKYHPKTHAPLFPMNDLHERIPLEPISKSSNWKHQSNLGHLPNYNWIYSRRILDYEIAPSNNQYAYIVLKGDFRLHGNNVDTLLRPALLRSKTGLTNGGVDQHFFNITHNLPMSDFLTPSGDTIPLSITGIEVDPLNAKRIWVSFSGYEENKKVWYSSDAGETWSNYDSAGTLANLPVNDIIYQPGSKDRMFAATDAGVYVNEQGTGWCRFGTIPNVRVMELKINPCDQSLIAATIGRGLWKAPLPSAASLSTYKTIIANTTWSGNRYSTGNIIVANGKTLKITGTLHMPKNGRIIVETGAKLWVNGGKITNSCGALWSGIEAWGKSDKSQFGSNQGEILVTNHAIIEHAQHAMQGWRPGHWDKTGGIVRVFNSKIINCKNAVGLMNYSNIHLGETYNNKAEFKDVEFIWDDEFRRSEALEMVSLYKVSGVSFNACKFEDQRTILPVDQRSHGIHSLDASFQVKGSCGSMTGCPDDLTDTTWNLTTFSNLDVGILAGNSSSIQSVTVDRCEFTNNIYGIILSHVDYAQVTNNRFLFTPDIPEDISNACGLLARYSSDFRIEENSFIGTTNTLNKYGIYVDNSGELNNELYKNNFTSLTKAIVARRINRSGGSLAQHGMRGLEFICNSNTSNTYDIYVAAPSSAFAPEEGVKKNNGLSGSANTFSHLGIFGRDYTNLSDHPVFYHYNTNLGAWPEREPITSLGLLIKDSNAPIKQCPSLLPTYPSGWGHVLNAPQRSLLQLQFAQSSNAVQARIATLNNLENGGNTDQLLNQIGAITTAADAVSLKDTLQKHSPYLTGTIVDAVLQISDQLFLKQWKRDLIIANIEVAYRKDFISQLNLPSQMVSSIQSAIDQNQHTNLSVLQKEIDSLHQKESFAVGMLIRNYMNDTINSNKDSIKSLIVNRFDPLQSLREIDAYLDENNIAKSKTLTQAINPNNNSYPTHLQNNISSFVSLKNLLNPVLDSAGKISQLDTSTLNSIRKLATEGVGFAKAEAQNILCFFYNECDAIELMTQSQTQQQFIQTSGIKSKITDKISQTQFSLFPNPANGSVKLIWENKTDHSITIKIVDLLGKTILIQEGKDNEFDWNTRKIANGTYFVSIHKGSEYLGTRKVLIQH